MSEFTCEVVKIGKMVKHSNADALEITEVNGLPVVCKSGTYKEGDLAVYIPLDAVVPVESPYFSFLKKKDGQLTHRVKAIRLRGVYSEGLLIPAPTGGSVLNSIPVPVEGADMAQWLGVTKYVQPIGTSSEKIAMAAAKQAKDPGCAPHYSLDPFQKYAQVTFEDGEEVVATEKVHGCNARFVYTKGELFVGSHNTFRKLMSPPTKVGRFWNAVKYIFTGSSKFTLKERWNAGFNMFMNMKVDPWWKIAKKYNLEEKLKDFEGFVLYGEVYGHVQDLTYSVPEEDVVHFAAFDVYDSKNRAWAAYDTFKNFCAAIEVPRAPELFRGPYSKSNVEGFRSGKSAIDGKTMREGLVVRSVNEHTGHKRLKLVSEEYKLRDKATEFK